MERGRNGNVSRRCVRRRSMTCTLLVMNNLCWRGFGLHIVFGDMLLSMKVTRIHKSYWFLGHCLKNDQTQLAHAVGTLNAEYRLLLTGTPLQKYFLSSMASTNLVRCMSCGRCSISYTPMCSMKRVPTLSKTHSILLRGHTIRNLLRRRVLYFPRWCCEEWKLIWQRSSYHRKRNYWYTFLWLLFNGIHPPWPVESNWRFWYKRMITRLDTGTLNEVVHGMAGVIKPDLTAEEKVDEVIAERRSLQTKTESAETAITQRKDPADKKSTAWQKLMNLLMQLRKICNQYPPLSWSSNP